MQSTAQRTLPASRIFLVLGGTSRERFLLRTNPTTLKTHCDSVEATGIPKTSRDISLNIRGIVRYDSSYAKNRESCFRPCLHVVLALACSDRALSEKHRQAMQSRFRVNASFVLIISAEVKRVLSALSVVVARLGCTHSAYKKRWKGGKI